MNLNMGQTDRVLRIAAGVALLLSYFVLQGEWRWLALIGLVPLLTGLVRWCPAYALLGLDTCAIERKST